MTDYRLDDSERWTQHAQCAKLYAPYMFPREDDTKMVRAAKAACDVCPVVGECLSEAMRRGEPHGIWGGMTASERAAWARRTSRRNSARKVTVDPAAAAEATLAALSGLTVEEVA